MKLCEKIKLTRLKLKLTQEQFASEMGVTRSCIQKWEKGTRVPSKMALNLLDNKFKYHSA